MAVVGAFKKKGRQYDKTFTTGLSPVGKQGHALAGVRVDGPSGRGLTRLRPEGSKV